MSLIEKNKIKMFMTLKSNLHNNLERSVVPFRATETIGLAELLQLINLDVLKHG